MKQQVLESFQIFEKHYRAYKSKVNYADSRLSFEVISFFLIFFQYFLRSTNGDQNFIGISPIFY